MMYSTLTCNFRKKGPNTDFHPGLILLNTGILSRKNFRRIVNDGLNILKQTMHNKSVMKKRLLLLSSKRLLFI